jgi:hypothetical protein
MPVGAALGAAGLGAAGSIGGALIGQGAQDNAIGAEKWAMLKQIEEQQREYDTSRADLAPWRTTGGSALDQLARIYGLDTSQNGKTVKGTATTDFTDFWKSPDYNIAMQQGIAGVDAGAAARGSLDSGATRKAELTFGSNLGAQQFDNYANRLAGIAGVGQTAATQTGLFGQNAANQIGTAYGNYGNELASSYLAQGNMWGNALSGVANIGSGLISKNPQWFGG